MIDSQTISPPPIQAESPQHSKLLGPSRGALGAFLLSAVILLVGLSVSVDVEHASLFGVEGPVCFLGELGGDLACPSCGLTRSTSLILQGEISSGIALNPNGLLVVLFATVGFGLGALSFLSARAEGLLQRFSQRAGRLFMTALLSVWLFRLFT
jgi:hypothetical protein